jgi:hypothetical protein
VRLLRIDGTDVETLYLPVTCPSWDAPVRESTISAPHTLQPGRHSIELVHRGPDWSNYCDLYAAGGIADKPINRAVSPPSTGFVTRQGIHLWLDGARFNLNGVNCYPASGACYGNAVDESYFPQLAGLTVRFWCFDGGDLASIDNVFRLADKYGFWLIPVLADHWGNCEPGKDDAWYDGGYRGSYLAWVRTICTRYRQDRRVVAWELINEPEHRGPTQQAVSSMRDFITTTAATIRSVDPNHLISVGIIGGSQPPWDGGLTVAVLQGVDVDLLGTNCYQSEWNSIPGAEAALRLEQARSMGIAHYIKEAAAGWPAGTPSPDSNIPVIFPDAQVRAAAVEGRVDQLLAAGSAGLMWWNSFKDPPRPDNTGAYLDHDLELLRVLRRQPTPPPPPVGLEATLATWFPSNGPTITAQWGDPIGPVLPGTTIVVPDGERGLAPEWMINNLVGTDSAWITIRPQTVLGFKAVGVTYWRGIGLRSCEYVRVDGFDIYGRGNVEADGSGDFASAVEAIGGHNIAVTRCRGTGMGGGCVTFCDRSTRDKPDYLPCPANTYTLYNTAIECCRRNMFNTSAFSIYHAQDRYTDGRPLIGRAAGPLAYLGYTDYIVGNQAYGCECLVPFSPAWGITDGNCVICDQGNESGFTGRILVAFNVGADCGGRGVHALNTAEVDMVFNTMVGNQRTLKDPNGGEISLINRAGQINSAFGNVAAATNRDRVAVQTEGRVDHRVSQNVILVGSSEPHNIPVDSRGLAYLRGGTVKSRVLDDYRPVAGTALTGQIKDSLFAAVAVFPGPDGQPRRMAIAGALDQ